MFAESIEKDVSSTSDVTAGNNSNVTTQRFSQPMALPATPLHESWELILSTDPPCERTEVWNDVNTILQRNNLSPLLPSLTTDNKMICISQLLNVILPAYASRSATITNIVEESNEFEERIKELEGKTSSLQRDRISLSNQLRETETRHNNELSRLRQLTEELCETCEFHKQSCQSAISASQRDRKSIELLKTQQTERLNRGRALYERIVKKSDFSTRGKVKGGGKRDTSTTDLVEYCEALINRSEFDKSALHEPQKIIEACDLLSYHVEKALLPEEVNPTAVEILTSTLSFPTQEEVWKCVSVLLQSIAATLPALQNFLTGICREISEFRTSVSRLLSLPLDPSENITPTSAVPMMKSWTKMINNIRALNEQRNAGRAK
eukprot:TRINITY_DN7806_c0_g1_i1.p1 TRINITY_DN7806_c0_g1~~TRINITY_DN7806_c0_g1_i1.p1  ORF type:complete len:380 (+),score=70.94 TRINITY_DN7806_c0_g1_i1:59-1198(+)